MFGLDRTCVTDRVGLLRPTRVLVVGLVDDDQHALGDGIEESCEIRRDRRRRRSGCSGCRPRSSLVRGPIRSASASRSTAPSRSGASTGVRAVLAGVDHVRREGRPAGEHLVARLEVRAGQVADDRVGAVAERDLRRRHAVAVRQALDQDAVELGVATGALDLARRARRARPGTGRAGARWWRAGSRRRRSGRPARIAPAARLPAVLAPPIS